MHLVTYNTTSRSNNFYNCISPVSRNLNGRISLLTKTPTGATTNMTLKLSVDGNFALNASIWEHVIRYRIFIHINLSNIFYNKTKHLNYAISTYNTHILRLTLLKKRCNLLKATTHDSLRVLCISLRWDVSSLSQQAWKFLRTSCRNCHRNNMQKYHNMELPHRFSIHFCCTVEKSLLLIDTLY